MVTQILHASQWCWRHRLTRVSRILDKLNQILCSTDIPGKADIAHNVAFPHNGLGVVINNESKISSGCVINANVTLGSGFPHDGAPKLGKNVWVGVGAFCGGISIADDVVIGANSVVTKSISESGVIVAGCPAQILRKLTSEELTKIRWDYK